MPNEKTSEELRDERVVELERQLKYLKEEAVEWKKTHAERWEEDVKRLEDELAKLKPVEMNEVGSTEPVKKGRPKKVKVEEESTETKE